MRLALVVGVVMALDTATRAVAAQELSTLAPGTRLRVNARCEGCVPRLGDFVRFASDTLWLRGHWLDEPIESRAIITLERLRRKDRATGTGRGALVGLLLGTGVGLAIGLAAQGAETGPPVPFLALGPIGAVIGGLAGTKSGGEEWVPVPLPPVRGQGDLDRSGKAAVRMRCR